MIAMYRLLLFTFAVLLAFKIRDDSNDLETYVMAKEINPRDLPPDTRVLYELSAYSIHFMSIIIITGIILPIAASIYVSQMHTELFNKNKACVLLFGFQVSLGAGFLLHSSLRRAVFDYFSARIAGQSFFIEIAICIIFSLLCFTEVVSAVKGRRK